MYVKTSSFARSAALLCAFALLSCTTSTDETGRAEAASTVEDAGADASTPPSLFAGGAGTEASPYQVASCAQLQALDTAPYAHFVLTADIDCTGFDAGDGRGFRPIGSDDAEFGGRVNGQGHVITGLRIARPSQDRVGLFGRTRWAVLENFGLVSPVVTGRDDVGALVGWQRWGLVEEVSVRGATVTGRNRVGALVGHMHHSKVYNSYARAELTCTKWDDFSGGGQSLWNRTCGQLVGTTVHGIVVNSYAAVEAAPHFGLAGGSAPRTHTAAFYDCDIVAGCGAPHVERRTTSQLQSEAYLVSQQWDFLSVWDIAAAGTYPCLQWEPGCGEPSCAPTDATCNGVDDDCNGTVDEDFASTATTCGVGACGSTGATSCVAGAVVDSCAAGSATGTDADCDGADNDCDASTDEAYVPTATSCGVGACGATGATSCVAGAVVDSCAPGTPTGTDATCDGLDDDCDGDVDEAFAPAATSCGVGACGATGSTSCVAGAVVDSCEAETPASTDATCDGVDDDCNGTADEDFAPTATACGVGACGATGATSCVSGAVVDSCEAGTPVGTDATCDGVDNDCDASTDEAYAPVVTSCGVGACGATGSTSCVAGAVVDSCEAGTPVGTDATCDGVDDDCDASTDEAYAPTATSCGVGACGTTGSTSCVAGAVVDSCEAGTPAGTDATCDGLDDDCDGDVDEAFASAATTCGVGACGATGSTSCVAGAVVDSCEAGTPVGTDATCDEVDNDCDASTDEAYAPTATSCGVGACGATGLTSCVSGAVVDSCEAGTPASTDATCDGVDDDCNGTADEDFAPTATACGVGACGATGATSCVSGAVVDSCEAGTPVGTDATCDGVDNDCDASTDEAYALVATSCGVGACGATGATSCVSGAVVDSCEAGTPAGADATCDEVDDDCDGTADEDFAPTATTCGVGACGATGATSCVSGAVVDSCEAGTPASTDATCDGVDNDCNGTVDEDFVATATTCGVGACGATGSTSCVSGAVVDSCEAGSPTGADATCDGLDDDCDGDVDEAFAPAATSCGAGVCGATGSTSCVAGAAVNSCTPGAPTGTDTDCDRVDDDCDGQTDEAYTSTPTECGVGACSATGSLSCNFGRVVDSCRAGAPSDDANCDNVDQDCDGAADDDYQPTETTCGIGTCASTGAMTCQSGVEVDSCRVGLAWPNDVCDGLDDDCDGTVDEGFVSVATSCGFGVCAAMGATSCVSGTVVSLCASGATTGDDSDCDGTDDDCDGGNDEGFAARCAGTEVESCVGGSIVRAACSDQNACNGEETCVLGACIPGQAQLDDGDVCTIDVCDPVTGIRHEQAPAGFSCSDGNPCNGEEQCGPTVPELLRNRSFEAFTTPNTQQGAIPAEWLASFPSPDTYSNDASFGLAPSRNGNFNGVTAHDGIRWIAGWSSVPEEFGQTLSEPLEPGVRYRVSAYLRRSTRSDLRGLGTYEVYLATGTVPDGRPARTGVRLGAFPPLTASPAGAWQFRSFEFVAPADAAQRRLITFSPAVGSDSLSTYPGFDLASLTRVTPFPWGCLSGGAVTVSDGNPCTADLCDPETGIAHVPVAADTPCADTSFCNGEEVCDGAGQCRVGVALDVSDGLVCTTDSCDPVVGIRHLPVPTGTACGTNGTCDSTGFCSSDENHWPVFVSAPLTTLALVSSAPASDYEYTAVASDLDGDTLTYQLVASPIGMTIDAITGRVRWYVDSSRAGTHAVTIRANDGFGGVADQSFTLDVTLANGTPRILSAPLSYGRSGIPYRYQVLADDPDGDPIAFQLLRGPAGMTVDASGLISWPLPNVGTELVVVSVSDPSGRTVRQSYSLVITMPSAPRWTSTPLRYARDGWTYAYASRAIDTDPGDVVHYGLLVGPVGLGIDPVSGLVTWVPAASQRGLHAVTLGATDNDGLVSVQSFDVLVSGENQSPVFTSSPRPTLISPGVEWLYPVGTLDPDGDDVAVSLVSPLADASIGSGNVLRFTPTAADIGDHLVSLVADDGRGGMTTQRFRLTVSDAIAPRFVTVPPLLATQDMPYAYDAVAVDANPGDIVRYRLTTAPAGMTIKPSSGRVRWTPSPSQVGSHTVTIVASDNANHTAVQRWVLTVQSEDDAPPSVTLTATPDRLEVGETTILHVEVLDTPAYTIQSLTVDGTPLSVDLNGNASYVGLTPGVLTATATVVGPSGDVRVATTLIRVLDASDEEPPTVSLTSPEDSAELTYLHDVVGSVSDENLYQWRVTMRFVGEADETIVLQGSSEVSNDILGQLDTTQILNGLYILRLVAEDVNGLTSDVTRPVRVSGDAKLGAVRFSLTDIAMPTHDVPITVTRHYDSTDPREGAFGFGWRMEESESTVQVSRPLGDGVVIWTRRGDFTLPCTESFEQKQHSIEVRLSDDEYYVFGVDVSNFEALSGSCTGDVFFEQVAGTVGGAELLPLSNTRVRSTAFGAVRDPLTLPPGALMDIDTGEVWNATQFVMELPDGRRYHVDTARGTTALEGRNGLFVSYNGNSTVHSGGRYVAFERDSRGRIVQIRDQDDRTVEYSYDAAGDLVAVADQLGRVTTYEYDPLHAHHLVAITDYRGVRVLAAEYQDDGRLLESCDGDSVCGRFEYDLPARRMVTVNSEGRETAHRYDALGRVVETTDALGNEWTYGYSTGSRNLVSETDPTGARRTYTYDDSGRRASETDWYGPGDDPAEWRTTFTYAAGHWEPATTTLPQGGTLAHTYDGHDNPLSLRDGDGNVVWSRTYDATGRVASQTDRFGTTGYAYADDTARPITITLPTGETRAYTYDASGQVRTIDAGSDHVVHAYDEVGRRLSSNFGNGVTVTYEYGAGNSNDWTAITGPTFGRVERTLTVGNRLSRWTEPNGDSFRREYDAQGQLGVEVDELGNRTEHMRDAAGRVTSITDVATGAVRTFEYDDAGRVTLRRDALGNETRMTYGPGGRMESMTDARGKVWTFDESPTTSVNTNPLGHATTRGVNGYGVPTVTSFADMTSVTTTPSGQTAVDESDRFPDLSLDEANRPRDWTYDPTGVLTGATDLGGGPPWGYAYETHLGGTIQWDLGSGEVTLGHTEGRPGADTYTGSHPDRPEVPALETESWRRQLRTFTSPEGEVTQRDYTAQGQLAAVTLPWGASTGMAYGADGEVDTQTLASGETVTFTHDGAGRLLSRTAGAQDFATFAYGAGDRVTSSTDATGTTSYAHDVAGRRTGLTYPSGGRVQYEHDAEDRVTAVVAEPVAGGPEAHRTEYTYDLAGNVATVTDPTGGVTEYEYDDAGRRTERRYPNGITTTWTYDVRDRTTSVTHTRVADGTVLLSRAYVRAATGEPTRITHEDGTYVALTYDAALRIASETFHAANDSVLSEVSYTYDQDGNRTSRTVDGETETYVYTSGSRLTEVSVGGVPSQTFAYDTGGRVTELRRAGQNLDLTWDSSDHVVGVTNVDTTGEVQWHFDASGRRTGRDEGSSARRYLVAPNAGQNLESPQLVMDGLGNTQVGYVFEGEHPIARYGASGVPEYYLEDGIRSVVGVVDDTGSVVETYAYDSFGVTRDVGGGGAGAEPDGFGFQGMWRDADGTYFVRARVYDAVTGRFLSRDPAEGVRERPETYAAYGFAGQNPAALRDPTGEFTMGEQSAVHTIGLELVAVAVAYVYVSTEQRAAVREVLSRGRVGPQDLQAPGLEHYSLPGEIHRIKRPSGPQRGADNIEVDPHTGDVYDKKTGEYIGNMFDA